MSKIFDSIKVYGSGTTNSSSTLDTYDSSGTTTFTIKDGGNVGIGTSSPSEKLEVNGDIKITSQSNVLKIGSYSALSITQGVGAANVIVGHNNTMNDSGNGGGVVIGANSTSTDNGIAIGLSSTISLGTTDGIAIGRSASISNSSIRGVAIGREATVTANNAFAIGNYTTANQNDTIILGNNSLGVKPNVGIGTSNPLTTLHVNGKATIQGDVDVFGNVNVLGTATTLNTETVQTRDNKILLNYSGTNVTAVGGGISVLSANTIYTSGLTELITDINGDWNSNVGLNITGRTSDNSSNGLTVKNSSGTNNFVVRNDGNVGIGTSNPITKFMVDAGSSPSQYMYIKSTGVDCGVIIDSGEYPAFVMRSSGLTSFAMQGVGQNTMIFRPTSSIEWRAGDTNTSMYGSVNMENATNSYSYFRHKVAFDSTGIIPSAIVHIKGSDTSSSNYGLKVQDSGGTDNLVVRNDGNVGIGTNSPTEVLNIYKSGFNQANLLVESDTNTSNLILNSFKNGTGTSGGSNINFKSVGINYGNIFTSTANSRFTVESLNGYDLFLNNTNSQIAISDQTIRLITNGENRLTVLNNGDIGIGTTSPSTKLHISGTTEEILKVESSNASSGVMSVYNENISTLNLRSSTDTTMSIWGFHGIGGVIKSKGSLLFRNYTNNTQYAQVDNIDSNPSWGFGNQLGSGSPSSDTRIRIVGQDSSSSNYGLKVQNSGGTDNFVVRNDGNIGIGTSSPSEKLDVIGKTKTTTLQVTSGATTGYILTSDSSGNGTWQAPVRAMTYLLGHDSVSPSDSNTYYIGSLFVLAPVTSSQDSRRVTVQRSGTITDVGIMTTIGGTLGSGELSTFTINNVTSGTSSTITTGATHSGDSNINYTLSSPLTVTKNDKIEVRWVTPVWATNPTTVRQMINVVLSY